MSCDICGVNVPKPTEALHSQWHAEMVYAMSQLSRPVPEVVVEQPTMPFDGSPLTPESVSRIAMVSIASSEAEAFWRGKISAELTAQAVAPERGQRPKRREIIEEVARSVAKKDQ